MSRPRASRALENVARSFGFVRIAGVDEVGRGCLAGPVVAAAVVLDPSCYVSGIADSKVLTAAERERLFDLIVGASVGWSAAIVEADEIDRINIHRASLQAMRTAVTSLVPLPGFVLVDGFRIPDLVMPQRAVIGGDRRSTAIAAASILAKVTRDRLMLGLHEQDPRYGFDRHKGYATKDHLDAVARFGYRACTGVRSGRRRCLIRCPTDTRAIRLEHTIRLVSRLLVAGYLVEAGLLLILAPWTALWEHNYFGQTLPWLGTLMENEFVRGGVTGVGVITLAAGLRDLVSALFARQNDQPTSPGSA